MMFSNSQKPFKNGFFLGLILFSFNFFDSYLSANVLDHLKKIDEKQNKNPFQEIDFIYLINLDHRPEKYQACLNQLLPYGIEPYRFSAVWGWKLDLDTINDVGVKYEKGQDCGFLATSYLPEDNFKPHHENISVPGRTYFGHCLSRGAIGIVLSHLSVLKDAYDSGFETIWVMEDDIKILQSPFKIKDLISKLDKKLGYDGWDIFFTDSDYRANDGGYVPARGYARRPNYKPLDMTPFYEERTITPEIKKIGARFGATSMIIRRSGMKKLLDFFEKYGIYHPYDMDYTAPEGIRVYSSVKDIISNGYNSITDNGHFHIND